MGGKTVFGKTGNNIKQCDLENICRRNQGMASRIG
jgi:hypothetical protein